VVEEDTLVIMEKWWATIWRASVIPRVEKKVSNWAVGPKQGFVSIDEEKAFNKKY
jgi:hypothetical protein